MLGSTYSIHILFSDGSNPYWKRGMTYPELLQERRRWRQNYTLELIPVDTIRDLHIYNYRAKPKVPAPQPGRFIDN
jgi:hypothetical protein